ncbi:MAG: peptidylprolyl isomerase [Rhodobacteraceae bacterium]|nr:peptidylprolyl isomerase [Paracoccaceae bacterium]
MPALAQSGPYAPVMLVNERAVTEFELEQRIRFLTLLRVPGDPEAEAMKGLIEDRLRQEATKRAGITPTKAQIAAGMAEFAGRANLDTEQFLAAIAQGGVEPESFRDFVAAGIGWRQLVRDRFAQRVVISEAEVDRALSVPAQRGSGPRVLLSEIIIPNGSASAETQALATELSETIRSEGDFARAAAQHSAAASRAQGGKLGWIPLTNLPAQARPVIAGMRNGQVSPPIPLGNAIAIFQLRGVQQGGDIDPRNITVDYAQYLIPGGRGPAALAEAERVRGEVDTCDDLYRVASGKPAEWLTRETRALPQVPSDIAAELSRLDDRESSIALVRGDALVFLMLCKRSATIDLAAVDPAAASAPASEGVPAIDPELGFGAGPSRAQVRDELFNQRLSGLADGWLAELRANARIRTP